MKSPKIRVQESANPGWKVLCSKYSEVLHLHATGHKRPTAQPSLHPRPHLKVFRNTLGDRLLAPRWSRPTIPHADPYADPHRLSAAAPSQNPFSVRPKARPKQATEITKAAPPFPRMRHASNTTRGAVPSLDDPHASSQPPRASAMVNGLGALNGAGKGELHGGKKGT